MKKYSCLAFGQQVNDMIQAEIANAMFYDYSRAEAAVLVAQVAISSAVGYTAAAMGKRPPTPEEVGALTNKIIGLVAELPADTGRGL